MRRFLLSIALLVLLTAHKAYPQAPLGSKVVVFPFASSQLLADPVRSRVYAAVPTTNSVAVINTLTLQVIANVATGSEPIDLAISRDGNTLYVANNGSSAAAIGVVDLNSLTLRASFPLPAVAQAVAAGLDGRVYASITDPPFDVYQLDGTTGAIQTTLPYAEAESDALQISPDGTTLYTFGALVQSFDVSTATPVEKQMVVNDNETVTHQIILSHDGNYYCAPIGAGNGSTNYGTILYSASNLGATDGIFDTGAYPGPLAFSPDDTLIYQARQGLDFDLNVFSTQTFIETASAPLPTLDTGYPTSIACLTLDRTGTYVFAGETAAAVTASGDLTQTGQTVVVTTGAGPLPLPLPLITLAATTPSVAAGSGATGEFTLTRTGGDMNQTLTVGYTVKGTAVNGTDYVLLKGTAKLKPGKTSKPIKVVPLGMGASAKRTVVLTLQAGDGYVVGTPDKVKVRIVGQ